MDRRIGVVGIVLEDRNKAAQINSIISEFGKIIIGRMGVPYRNKELGVISLMVEGSTDEIGALTGKLGSIKGVQVKSALSKKF
ncbi:putative iron-only hydrogenase system regulator [Desulfohalotomaculum tongense]|uniref:TM1266 family iron-only hydrogenase system putative regulator n=1 Tax=Desulforadius tongensis TaxID=1216062 RepID=UPI001955F6BF|nr:putative iron-only hydrogenase system regulator [Desulforadius tongensis]